MATFRDFWHRLLRAVGMGALAGPDWVEPSNAITRAIDRGSTFVMMTSWEEQAFTPAPPAPMSTAVSEPVQSEMPGAETEAPARKGVAA